MQLRIGFDLDGVLADFGSAFREIEGQLFGADAPIGPGSSPEEEAERVSPRSAANLAAAAKEIDRRHQAVWARIRATRDF